MNGGSLSAQTTNDEIEVYLTFEHRNVINSGIVAYYKDNEFYLPIGELFSLLSIDYNFTADKIEVTGRYLKDQTAYRISLDETDPFARLNGNFINLDRSDYLIKDLDYYLHPDIYRKIFDLNFIVDFSNLELKLETPVELPAVQKLIREIKRRRLEFAKPYQNLNYTTRFDRRRKIIGTGFVDYNLSTSYRNNKQTFFYNSSVGAEVLGGDLQGSISGSVGETSRFQTNNLRWRTVISGTPVLRSISLGQGVTEGLISRSFTGITLSNSPIQPRLLFDEFDLSGQTIPRSEVELYLNNTLIDFQEADNQGNYRFLVPLTYGNSLVDLRIFSPTGRIIENSRRIQIPFSFIPEGQIDYTVNAGTMENAMPGKNNQVEMFQGNVGAGITNWLSTQFSTEYYGEYHDGLPTMAGSFTARVNSQYLITGEYAHNQFYRIASSAVFPNSSGFNINYVDFLTPNGIYNPTSTDKELSINAYTPFLIGNTPFTIRTFGSRFFRSFNDLTRFQVDLNTRIKRLNLRTSFSDIQTSNAFFELSNNSLISFSSSFSLPRSPDINALLRSMFIRGQVNLKTSTNSLESVEFFIARDLFQTGQIQFTLNYNLRSDFLAAGLNLSIALDKVRSTTNVRSLSDNYFVSSNLRGSIGFDQPNKKLILSDRNQVGRSAAAVRLFVDDNNNEQWDKGEEVIRNNAIRLNRSGLTRMRDGMIYITQLRPYEKYNMEINKGAIQNPMLVPKFEKFGIVTDPNFFKPIEIPFYITGVIEGQVERVLTNGSKSGLPGVKLQIASGDSSDNPIYRETRTFNDGTFYDYEIPPGSYTISLDTTSIQRAGFVAEDPSLDFTIEPLPNGDFVTGLNFTVNEKEKVRERNEQDTVTEPSIGSARAERNGSGLSFNINIPVEEIEVNQCGYALQLASFSSLDLSTAFRNKYSTLEGVYEVYNMKNNLYTLRMSAASDLSASSDLVRDLLNNYPDLNPTLITKCNGTKNDTGLFEQGEYYALQFAALSSERNALTFSNTLNERYNIDTFMHLEKSDRLYKVRMGAYNNIKEAQQARTQIIARTDLKPFITKASFDIPSVSVEFTYQLELGQFDTERQASIYALRIEEAFDVSSKIIIDEKSQIILVVNREFETWAELLTLKNNIESNNTFREPIIHLIEWKSSD